MNELNEDLVAKHVRGILRAIGADVESPGLIRTPERVAEFWEEFINYDPGNVDVTFECVTVDQLVVLKGVEVWSMCEHHMLPFFCNVSVGYIAGDHVIGVSKLARIVYKHAHRLQLQERMVHDIAMEVQDITKSIGVAVIADGQHTCMQMRGIKASGTMITSAMYGVFRDKPESRAEFLSLIGR